jgi:hypothetical protein
MAGLRRALFGYSSTSVHALVEERERQFQRASRNTQAAEDRADRLVSELRATQGRLGDAEEQLRAGRDFADALAMGLERSVAERETMEADLVVLRRELDVVKATLATTETTIEGKDRALRDALGHIETLRSRLTERTAERDALTEELAKARDESAEYKESWRAEQASMAGLAEQLTSYRTELEQKAGGATSQPQAEASARASEGPSIAPELDEVLQLTEEAIVHVMESARDRADQELRRLDQDRERLSREVEAMRGWRDGAAPIIVLLQSTMADVIRQADEIGLRVDEVVRPLTGAITRLGSQLSTLDAFSMTAPASVEPGNERSDRVRVIELWDEQTDDRGAGRDR